MQRPELEARVVGPDGKTQMLDPKTIAVSSALPGSAGPVHARRWPQPSPTRSETLDELEARFASHPFWGKRLRALAASSG